MAKNRNVNFIEINSIENITTLEGGTPIVADGLFENPTRRVNCNRFLERSHAIFTIALCLFLSFFFIFTLALLEILCSIKALDDAQLTTISTL